MRDSFIFYRSFYEAIRDLPRDIQGEIYTAIMEYSLYGNETDNLKPIARSIFTLIKPQIDVNNKRFENGSKGGRPKKSTVDTDPKENHTETKQKPKENQNATKAKPNNNDNVNDNYDIKKESSNEDKKERELSSCSPELQKFNKWLAENAPYCAKNLKPLSECELKKLKVKYTGSQISSIIEQIENRKDLRKKYTNLYRTILNWAKNEYGG